MKNLDLSYNVLQFDEGKPGYQDSIACVKNMVDFISTTDVLNHLSLQGMGYQKPQLLEICTVACTCPNLLAIHLSDNGIIRDEEAMIEILELFSLGSVDVKYLTRSKFEINRKNYKLKVTTEEIQAQIDAKKLNDIYN